MSNSKFNPKDYVDHLAKEAKSAATAMVFWMLLAMAVFVFFGVIFYTVTSYPNYGILVVLVALGIAYCSVDYLVALKSKNSG
jgi:hypothetical protein